MRNLCDVITFTIFFTTFCNVVRSGEKTNAKKTSNEFVEMSVCASISSRFSVFIDNLNVIKSVDIDDITIVCQMNSNKN